LVFFYGTAWCYSPEGCHIYTPYHENLKSHMKCFD
jgi:hypothetical protein